ncbi:MAG: hypothetical protein MK488_14755, partial [SAR324 cluster bacterium]|nr:hypothetical protein [SAR324 cluster bacterium]
GYANKIGFVNLSAGSVEFKDSPEDWKLKYVGGRGMGVKDVFENGPGIRGSNLDPGLLRTPCDGLVANHRPGVADLVHFFTSQLKKIPSFTLKEIIDTVYPLGFFLSRDLEKQVEG